MSDAPSAREPGRALPFVTKMDPGTSSGGGPARSRAVLEAYVRNGGDVSPIAALTKYTQDRTGSAALAKRFEQDAWDLLQGLVRSGSLTTARFYSRRLSAWLDSLAPGTPVHVDYSHMLVNLPRRHGLAVVVDCHNVESAIATTDVNTPL